MVLPALHVSADKCLYIVAAFRVPFHENIPEYYILDKLSLTKFIHSIAYEKRKNAARLNHVWILFLHSQLGNIKSFFYFLFSLCLPTKNYEIL